MKKKHGDLSLFYSAQKELLLYGTFDNDIFISGYIAKFTDEGNIIKINKYFNGKIEEKNESNSKEIEIVEKIMFNFRNIIMSKDYFGDIYKEFKEVNNFKNKNMNDINIFNSDKYLDLMDISTSYNQVSISKEIEKYLNQ